MSKNFLLGAHASWNCNWSVKVIYIYIYMRTIDYERRLDFGGALLRALFLRKCFSGWFLKEVEFFDEIVLS